MDVRVGLWRRLSTEELMLLNCGVEKTLESPLDCKEIQPVHSEEHQPWDFFVSNDAKAETPLLWPPHAKSWLIGKDSDAGRDWGQEEKGTTEDEMVGWHHRLDVREFVWTPGVGDGEGGLACCDSWGCRVGHDLVSKLNWLAKKFASWTKLLANTIYSWGKLECYLLIMFLPSFRIKDNVGLLKWVGSSKMYSNYCKMGGALF